MLLVDLVGNLLSEIQFLQKNNYSHINSLILLYRIRTFLISRIEQWLHNGKLGRVAQELLIFLCVNVNCNTPSDIEVISSISKLRMKTKPLTHFYCTAVR